MICSFDDCKNEAEYGTLCWIHLALNKGLAIQESTIENAGMGLFTLIDRKKNSIITEYTGKLITPDEAKNSNSHYLLQTTKNWIIDGQDKNEIGYGRWINEYKKPNVRFSWDAKNKIAKIRAIKNIKAGEELFLNYGNSYWS